MKTIIAAAAILAAFIATPASAQSYDPDLGTGNIARVEAPTSPTGAQGAFAQVRPGAPGAGHLDSGRGARASSPYSAYGAVTPFGSPANANSAAREAAVRKCSVLAAPYKEMTWGTMQVQTYRSCMAQQGHAE